MTNSLDDMPISVMQEYCRFMSGKHLGCGISRDVFEHPTDISKVIKVENSVSYFQNVKEWEVWDLFQFCEKTSIWLAPCHAISENGTFLIMDKVEDARPSEIPATLPSFLRDHKLENFGMLNGKFVCRDYGFLDFDLKLTRKKWQGSID